MSTNIMYFNKLSELVSLYSHRKPKIVLDPDEEYYIKSTKKFENWEDLNANIICDKTKWKIPDDVQVLVDSLSKDMQLSDENKILLIFAKLCESYIYDDNILSYLKRVGDDKFALPDWYGRDADANWEKSREEHNRRVCYEVSRYLAKALAELFRNNNNNFNVCVLWDVELAHYYVGLICDNYTITLDLDDFNNIKDFTRLKAGLTIEGINILEDDEGKFKDALDRFNEGRSRHAIKKIESEVDSKTASDSDGNLDEEPDEIIFFRNAMEILSTKYDIDSQGMYEYMKEIVDIRLGTEAREKVWKKIKGTSKQGTRYTRCLIINVNNKKYIMDVDEKVLREFDSKEFTEEDIFIPFKNFSRDWDEHYDGK